MLTSLRIPALAASLTLALPAVLDAQECAVDMTQPTQLFQANVLIQRAAGDPAGEATPRALRDAARQLQDARRFEGNPVGYAYARAQLFIVWLHRDDTPATMSQSDLNMGRDRNLMIDLVGQADSLLSVVETAMPECKVETVRWRQSKPWNDRIAAAYRLLGAQQVDSAERYAREAARLDRSSPFLFNAFAQIAVLRGQQQAAIAYLDTAIVAAAADTAMADTRRQMRTQQASLIQEWGSGLEDIEARKQALTRASRQFLAIAHESPDHADTPMFVSVGLDIAMLVQDSVLMAEGLKPMLDNPAPYPDLALLVGAEVSRMSGNAPNAITLYRETLKKNPNARDANYFLAYLLIDGNQGEEAIPMLDKLIEIDPSNGDNFLLKSIVVRNRATAAQTRRDATRDAAQRQALLREVRAHTAEADSLGAKESGMPHKLQVIAFERRAEGAKLNGTIENRSQAAKTYTVEMSFLDATGAVLETLTVTTESIAAGAVSGFELTATKPGIVAWRYKALQ
ncbi:MAG TPA: tetratricopeptide repeat protein [Gemmatimonadaceae bacterium]|nr:tetratricopeptide repeat protein [Gemmatimonadaceae bacterium]